MLIPADTDRLAAVATGHVEPVVTWVERDGRRQPGEQETDDATKLPLWTVHAMLMSDSRPVTIGVRVPAKECPAPEPLQPVRFEHLVCNARADRNGKLATYWSAAGVAEPATGRRAAPAQSDAA